MDLKKCPICGSTLIKYVIDERDNSCVHCSHCGEFMMTREFYDDYIDPPDKNVIHFIARYLKNHPGKLFFSEIPVEAPDGYKNIPLSFI